MEMEILILPNIEPKCVMNTFSSNLMLKFCPLEKPLLWIFHLQINKWNLGRLLIILLRDMKRLWWEFYIIFSLVLIQQNFTMSGEKHFQTLLKSFFCILFSILNLVVRRLLFQSDFFLCDGRKDLFKRQNVDLWSSKVDWVWKEFSSWGWGRQLI